MGSKPYRFFLDYKSILRVETKFGRLTKLIAKKTYLHKTYRHKTYRNKTYRQQNLSALLCI